MAVSIKRVNCLHTGSRLAPESEVQTDSGREAQCDAVATAVTTGGCVPDVPAQGGDGRQDGGARKQVQRNCS